MSLEDMETESEREKRVEYLLRAFDGISHRMHEDLKAATVKFSYESENYLWFVVEWADKRYMVDFVNAAMIHYASEDFREVLIHVDFNFDVRITIPKKMIQKREVEA